MATRVVGAETWKREAVITASGAVVSWTMFSQKPKRVHLGYAIGVVKDDHARVNWDWKGLRDAKA